jgi:hypothetical protein
VQPPLLQLPHQAVIVLGVVAQPWKDDHAARGGGAWGGRGRRCCSPVLLPAAGGWRSGARPELPACTSTAQQPPVSHRLRCGGARGGDQQRRAHLCGLDKQK